MSTEIEICKETLDSAIVLFGDSLDKLTAKQREFHDRTKIITREIKDAAENIGQGITRVEKSADFNRLERYVSLIERAATAMSLLAELEKSGKLEKIAGALK